MKYILNIIIFFCFTILFQVFGSSHATEVKEEKPGPDEVIRMLKKGNKRFYSGKSLYPHTNSARLRLAGMEDQGNHAYATVLTCSDSRVPPEFIFDAGVMDIFVVRVAGNVCNVDEIGSIEYGMAHVNTPVLVILGHTQCGAVTAVTEALNGKGHQMERNIPPLVNDIIPAVKKASADHHDIHGNDIIPYAIEENVWRSIHNLYMKSPAVRELVKAGKAKVLGAIYDVSTGRINWLPTEKSDAILQDVEKTPNKETKAFSNS